MQPMNTPDHARLSTMIRSGPQRCASAPSHGCGKDPHAEWTSAISPTCVNDSPSSGISSG